jgi:predicted XRE-type DNA-binding protein
MDDDEKRARVGSGNFLKDRGYDDPDLTRRKFATSNGIALMIEDLGVSRAEAAKIAGVSESLLNDIIDGSALEFDLAALELVWVAFWEHCQKVGKSAPDWP